MIFSFRDEYFHTFFFFSFFLSLFDKNFVRLIYICAQVTQGIGKN